MKKRYIFLVGLICFVAGFFVTILFRVPPEPEPQKWNGGSCEDATENQEIDSVDAEIKGNSKNPGTVLEEELETFYTVLQITDGDTFSVSIDGETESVRLIGIDTPENNEKYRSVECFGGESTKRAIELLEGKQIKLEADPTQADVDEYGRLLRYVFLDDGTFINQLLIEEGFAKEYTFKGSEYKYQKDFRLAESKAQKELKGLWGNCNAIKN